MKKLITFVVLLLVFTGFHAQAQTPDDTTIVTFAEQVPVYHEDLYKYLARETRYPEADRKANREGKVVLQFIIEKDGSVSNVVVVRHATKEMDAEAVRVIEAMQKWTPGRQNGKPVRIKFTLPVSFKLT